MFDSEKTKTAVGRFIAFVIGGLLVLLVMNMTVVSGAKQQVAQLTKELDESKFEASRLLADARAQFASREFDKAKQTLAVLLEKRPGSNEAADGKRLLNDTEAAVARDNARWEAAVAGIKERWARDMTVQLRGESEKVRLDMEKGLADTLAKEWEKTKDRVRQEWAKQG
jgi:hypothetical protein